MPLLYIVSFKEFGSLVCLWHDVKLRKTQLEVRSLTATWSRDLSGHRVVVFLEMCQIVGWTAMANLAALRAAVFSLSAKNLTGGGEITPPPAGASVKGHVSAQGQVKGQNLAFSEFGSQNRQLNSAGPSAAKILTKVRWRYCMSVNVILSSGQGQGQVTKG